MPGLTPANWTIPKCTRRQRIRANRAAERGGGTPRAAYPRKVDDPHMHEASTKMPGTPGPHNDGGAQVAAPVLLRHVGEAVA